jgi:cell division protein FtsI/penicillin-binding protein 2
MRHWILFYLSLALFACQSSETTETVEEANPSQYVDSANLIYQILAEREDSVLDSVINHPETFELQIFYTQIDRDSANQPSFTSHYYGIDTNNYFYPASTVKMPAAFLALEKLNELQIEGLTKYSTMLTDSAAEGQTRVTEDTTSESGMPSVAHYIKKIFLVSDNDAFNRLYEFLGQEYLNDKLHEKGYDQLHIVHRLAIFNTPEQNRMTNPVSFYDNAKILYQQELAESSRDFLVTTQNLRKGIGFMRNDSLINEPKDFTNNNFIAARTLQDMLKAVIFPNAVPEGQRFNLTEDDYRFLYRYMSQLPSETTFPDYTADTAANYYDSYSKFFLFGDTQESLPENIRIFNKIGMAYGYLTDNAYVVDFESNTEFLLTAVIYVNENQILNDGVYEYDEVGIPFLAELGRAIFEYEIARERSHLPDLSRYQVTYGKNNEAL